TRRRRFVHRRRPHPHAGRAPSHLARGGVHDPRSAVGDRHRDSRVRVVSGHGVRGRVDGALAARSATVARRLLRSLPAGVGRRASGAPRTRAAHDRRRRAHRTDRRPSAIVQRRRGGKTSHTRRCPRGSHPVTLIRPAVLALALGAAQVAPQCGSSSTTPGSPSPTPTPPSTLNMQSVLVNAGPNNDYVNGLFTSVTICQPGTSTCQTVSGILVDTGSSGLRVLSSAMNLTLPQQTSGGAPVVECAQFQDGFTWGPIQTADLKLSGETASSVPIQVI